MLLLFGVFTIAEVAAQKYDAAVGVRGGYLFTGTYKKFLNDSGAFEAYAGIGGYGGFVAGAMYQIHKPLEALEIENLDWYFGGGAYAGVWGSWVFGGNYMFAGVNVIIGLDYKLEDFPLNLSLDWGPGINLLRGDNYIYNSFFFPYFGGFSARYILGN